MTMISSITKTLILLCLGLLTSYKGHSQIPRLNSLIVSTYEEQNKDGESKNYVISFNFEAGILKSKDTLLSSVHLGYWPFGKNQIYKNRYIITAKGKVLDLVSKTVLVSASDNFIETRGDSIIFHRHNAYKGTGYLVYDLQKGTYGFVKNKNFLSVKGYHSPNHKKGLVIDKSSLPYKILLYDSLDNKEVIARNCGSTLLSWKSSVMSDVPLFWLDNESFLYASSNKSGHWERPTRCKMKIYKVNTRTKNSELITSIGSIPRSWSNSEFSRDPDQKIIFTCEKGDYIIDVPHKTHKPYIFNSYGNEFSIKIDAENGPRRSIMFEGLKIGKDQCYCFDIETTKGFIAIETEYKGNKSPHSSIPIPDKGFRVWNNIINTWAIIEPNKVIDIIGWIEHQ